MLSTGANVTGTVALATHATVADTAKKKRKENAVATNITGTIASAATAITANVAPTTSLA